MTVQNIPSTAELKAVLETALSLCKGLNLDATPPADLVPLIQAVQSIGAFATAINGQIEKRALVNGEMLPGVVVKDAIVHRKWHDQQAAEELAQEQFGDRAFTRALLSPAGIEKFGAEGKTFVAVASYKPEACKRVVY